MKKDHRSCRRNFGSCEKKVWKKIQACHGSRTRKDCKDGDEKRIQLFLIVTVGRKIIRTLTIQLNDLLPVGLLTSRC